MYYIVLYILLARTEKLCVDTPVVVLLNPSRTRWLLAGCSFARMSSWFVLFCTLPRKEGNNLQERKLQSLRAFRYERMRRRQVLHCTCCSAQHVRPGVALHLRLTRSEPTGLARETCTR